MKKTKPAEQFKLAFFKLKSNPPKIPATNSVVSRGACVRYQLWLAARQLLAQNFKGKHKEQPLAHKIIKKFQEILLKENIMPECLTIQ